MKPTKHKKSKLKLQQEFLNEIIADKKDINNEIVWNYFKYQNPYLLAKDLIRANKAKNKQLVIVDIVEKILNFNKQQKGKGIKTLTPKKMLQRLPIPLAQYIWKLSK